MKNIKTKKDTYILAEMAASYEGDPKIAEVIIEKSALAKADGILFQIRDFKTYIVPSDVGYQRNKEQCLSQEDWEKLIKKATSLGLEVWANVYDLASARFVRDKEIKGYKLHSSVLENEDLVREVIQAKKPLLLSIGGSEEDEIKGVMDLIYSADKNPKIHLMYGLQNFPTKPEGINFNFITKLSKKLSFSWGYQDHSDPEALASTYMPILAIAKGAYIIEKHITHNRAKKGIDHQAALNPNEFVEFASSIRIVDKILKKEPAEVSSDELQYKEYKTLMKAVTIKNIKAGDKFNKENIAVMRSKNGEIKGRNLKLLLGKTAKEDYQELEPIKRSELAKVGIFITVRLKSTRLPMKAIKPILQKPMLEWMIERLRHAHIEPIVVMTSTNPQDDPLVEIAKKTGAEYFRGSEGDVLLRIKDCAQKFGIDLIVATGADNPLIESIFIEKMVERYFEKNFDFCEVEGLPTGCGSFGGAYVITREAVEKICRIKTESDTEIWGKFLKDSGNFKCDIIKVSDQNIYRPQYRVTVDHPEDFELVTKIFEILLKEKDYFNIYDICKLLDERKDLVKINENVSHWSKK